MRVRLGVLSDLHCELEPTGSRWINPFEPELLDGRIDAALDWFSASEVDAIVLLGDIVQFANPGDVGHAFARVAAANGAAPLATVQGNHDLRLGETFAASAREHGIGLLWEEPLDLGGVTVAGVGVSRGPAPPQYVGQPGPVGAPTADLAVVASHFPVLSQAARVAAAGLPYAGDLVNRTDVELGLAGGQRPTVVLSGHIHARCSDHLGPVLQLTVGALIEPPYDATLVEIDVAELTVRRTARRLGEVALTDPVFCPDDEHWHWTGTSWDG